MKVKKPNGGSELTAAAALTSLSAKDDEDEDGEDDDEKNCKRGAFKIPQRFTKSGRKRATPFPMKLMKVLATKEYEDIITWMPSGRSFNILKPKAFVADILPDYFKTAKYSSFTRKLHRWGFMRIYRGDEAGAFFHKDFEKDRMDQLENMTCHKSDSPKSSTVYVSRTHESMPPAAPATQSHSLASKPAVQQQAKRQMPINMPQMLPTHSLGSPHQISRPVADAHSSADLNAAIEMEVSRRLKERINAAAFSRHALVMIQQQQQQQQQEQQMKALHDQRVLAWNVQRRRAGLQGAGLPGQSGFLTGPLSMGNHGFTGSSYGKFDYAMNYNQFVASADISPFHSIPSADIQGAKTA